MQTPIKFQTFICSIFKCIRWEKIAFLIFLVLLELNLTYSKLKKLIFKEVLPPVC